jgi:hypothetical protein
MMNFCPFWESHIKDLLPRKGWYSRTHRHNSGQGGNQTTLLNCLFSRHLAFCCNLLDRNSQALYSSHLHLNHDTGSGRGLHVWKLDEPTCKPCAMLHLYIFHPAGVYSLKVQLEWLVHLSLNKWVARQQFLFTFDLPLWYHGYQCSLLFTGRYDSLEVLVDYWRSEQTPGFMPHRVETSINHHLWE